jgi:hypothetical protein
MNSSGTTPPKRPNGEIEIREDGSTMDRFMNLTRRLLGVSREEIRQKEEEWKKDRQKRRNKDKNR